MPTSSAELARSDPRVQWLVRLGFLGSIFFVEKIFLDSLVDARRAGTAEGLGAVVRSAQHWAFRYVVTFVAALLVFAMVQSQALRQLHETSALLPKVRYRWLLVHLLLVALLAPVSFYLYRWDIPEPAFASIVGVWILGFGAAAVAAGLGLVPATIWLQRFRLLGMGWVYAAACALFGTSAWLASERLWASATASTFTLVTWLLMPIASSLTVEPANHVIGTANFAVEITQACSGLEGLGLTLAFSTLWLVYFRREYVFPRALILIPASLGAIFALNALRIAALLLIGDAGYPDVALFGFHSQAGWIAFNAVACALVFFSRRSRWLNRATAIDIPTAQRHNPSATYLSPLLSILAAGMLSHAMSGRFESLYPLRLIAAIATVVAFRHSLRALDWRFTWRGPAVGIAMFLVWATAAHWLVPVVREPEALAVMPPLQRAFWIASRCLNSIIFVPLAEELAYRGYLMRRFLRADFERVVYRDVPWPALALSAFLFGIGHGALWLPGVFAGAAYGMLAVRRGSLGEAVVAHAATNGLIAVTVLIWGQWQLW